MPYKDPKRKLEYNQRYRKKHPEKYAEGNRRYRSTDKGRRWTWKYKGIPAPAHPEPTVCESCARPPRGRSKTRLLPDHDHKTGKPRGWLCSTCNLALGGIGDDLASVDRLRAYLLKYT